MKLLLNVYLMTFVFLSGSALIAQERSIDNLFVQGNSWRERFITINCMPTFNIKQKEEKLQATFGYLNDLQIHQIRVKNSTHLMENEFGAECKGLDPALEGYIPCLRLLSFVLVFAALEESNNHLKTQAELLKQELSESLAHEVESNDHNAGSNDQSEATGEQSETTAVSDTPVQE